MSVRDRTGAPYVRDEGLTGFTFREALSSVNMCRSQSTVSRHGNPYTVFTDMIQIFSPKRFSPSAPVLRVRRIKLGFGYVHSYLMNIYCAKCQEYSEST